MSESPPIISGASAGAASSPAASKQSVVVLLKAAGDAPIMKKKKWSVDPTNKVGWIIDFIRKYIRCEPDESLFVYVNQSFSPAPDTEIRALYESFGADGKLILYYCKTRAWG